MGMASEPLSTLWWFTSLTTTSLLAAYWSFDLMYRDESQSETLLDVGHSHNFATAFLRNLRCSSWFSARGLPRHAVAGPLRL